MGGRVGEYEVGRTIASGAFSKVKLAVHVPTGKQCVAKILPKTNEHVENDIRVEISILRKVRHPHVVQLIEILESPRHYYIILEPVLGGDLCSLVMGMQHGIPEKETAALFLQLVQGVHACHRNGVAHRDLKPENILLTPDRQVKISDFGLSRLHRVSNFSAQAAEFAKTLTGTLAYVSPEVLAGQYDAFKADLWSLGCILYVMLTSHFPFGSAVGPELERRISAGEVNPLPPSVSGAARDLTMSLLLMNPKERPSLDDVINHPFFVLQGEDGAVESLRRTKSDGNLVTGSADTFEQVEVEDDGAGSPASPPGNQRRRRIIPA
ncbi:protein kinase, putative [Bodo saltans]|uniref:Protein kinase, putative n=1 Tax=Bodo saltans TaxID=75058 RepID=A0A0S4KMV7_BODSA|nr:protein kinase, putative [Bodo saltans]|eukprot:CUI14844.1 protein kinase, putative [Bodo saltans]